MAFEKNIMQSTAPSGADLHLKQFYGVYLDSSLTAQVAGTAGMLCAGVLQNNPTAGQEAEIMQVGMTKAIAASGITVMDRVAVTATGLFATATSGQEIVGVAMNTASTSDVFDLFLTVGKAAKTTTAHHEVSIPVNLHSIADGAILTTFVPGYACVVTSIKYLADVIASTASKLSTVTPTSTAGSITGGVLSLTTVACGTKGAFLASSSISGAGLTLTASDSITLTASATTTFTEGSGSIIITLAEAMSV